MKSMKEWMRLDAAFVDYTALGQENLLGMVGYVRWHPLPDKGLNFLRVGGEEA